MFFIAYLFRLVVVCGWNGLRKAYQNHLAMTFCDRPKPTL